MTRTWIILVLAAILLISPHPKLLKAQNIRPGSSPDLIVHIVLRGETFESIAANYGLTANDLRDYNGLPDSSTVTVGDRLVIPVGRPLLRPRAVVNVEMSESLTSIALAHRISATELGKTNRIVNPVIANYPLGLVLPENNLPETSLPWQIPARSSIWEVALRTNSSPAAISELNKIANLYLTVPGQSIYSLGDASEQVTPLNPPWGTVRLHPDYVEAGRTASLYVEMDRPGTLTATFLNKQIELINNTQIWKAVFGIDRWTASGLYPIELTFKDSNGQDWNFKRSIRVLRGGYQREEIQLSDDLASIIGDPAVASAEMGYLTSKMTGISQPPLWSGLFRLPTHGVITSAFGTSRSYGEGVNFSTFHTGTDFAAPIGTPIFAPADGVVIDTGELDIRGYITIIDHGMGVFTGYWHQSSILVKPGDKVKAGQQIGTIGDTGLSTAPHLHWEMWVAGEQVDPMQWVRDEFP